jgi:hypothetical protein
MGGKNTDVDIAKEAAAKTRLELISAKVHEQWIESKHKQGVTSRLSETNEELMVPYDQLSEAAKELDRGSVLAVLTALDSLEPNTLAASASSPSPV